MKGSFENFFFLFLYIFLKSISLFVARSILFALRERADLEPFNKINASIMLFSF